MSVTEGVLCAVVLTLLGCSVETAAPRAQALLVIDTDLPVPSQLDLDERLSARAAIDTVRVQVFDPDAGDLERGCLDAEQDRELVAPSLLDWPLSFGLQAPAAGSAGRRLVRLRAFDGRWGEVDECGLRRPPPEVAVDRLVELDLPTEGVSVSRITLSGDCRGVAVSFRNTTSCVDGLRLEEAASVGLEPLESLPSESASAGTWAGGHALPCTAPGPARDAVCVQGGFSILGGPSSGTLDRASVLSALPRRPVRVTPFWLDREEFSVGRLRALLKTEGAQLEDVGEPLSPVTSTSSCLCTWLGAEDARNDALPVNCVSWQQAARYCEAAGGRLPTEAEWEHAASGRGAGRPFPWGSESPSCDCVAYGTGLAAPACDPLWALPSGSSACPLTSEPLREVSKAGCHAEAAVLSVDGLRHLAGNVAELVTGGGAEYSSDCWAGWRGSIAQDPRCDGTHHVTRGGSWEGTAETLDTTTRRLFLGREPTVGFRCAYPEAEP